MAIEKNFDFMSREGCQLELLELTERRSGSAGGAIGKARWSGAGSVVRTRVEEREEIAEAALTEEKVEGRARAGRSPGPRIRRPMREEEGVLIVPRPRMEAPGSSTKELVPQKKKIRISKEEPH